MLQQHQYLYGKAQKTTSVRGPPELLPVSDLIIPNSAPCRSPDSLPLMSYAQTALPLIIFHAYSKSGALESDHVQRGYGDILQREYGDIFDQAYV